MTLNVIHLKERKDRFLLLEKELINQGIIDYKIWDGIKDDIEPWNGIATAHKRIVLHAKENKLPYVMIAEDDIQFTGKGALLFFLDNIPSDFDIYLGGIVYGKIQEGIVNSFSGMTLYIVNNKFYDTFLELPIGMHIDRALKNRGKFIVCNPMVAIQHNGFSDNSKRYMNYDLFTKKGNLFRRYQ